MGEEATPFSASLAKRSRFFSFSSALNNGVLSPISGSPFPSPSPLPCAGIPSGSRAFQALLLPIHLGMYSADEFISSAESPRKRVDDLDGAD